MAGPSQTGFVAPAALLRRHNLQAKKSWGQNFLHDPAIAARIVEAAEIETGDTVVEIGAGLGALTGLLADRAARVVAIERDRDLAAVLRTELEQRANVEIAEANALTYDFAVFEAPVVVLGNLPYNISSPLLFHLLDHRDRIRSAIVMLQRELAQRLAAGPGSRLYGIPSVLFALHADVQTALQVKRGAFLPPPRVDSTVIRILFRREPRCRVDPTMFKRVVRAAFAARRKTLLGTLGAAFGREQVARALEEADIDPRSRAETLALEQFARLSELLTSSAGRGND